MRRACTHNLLPVSQPKLAPVELSLRYLRRAEDARIYSNRGPLVRELEERLAGLLRSNPANVVACSSATLALESASFHFPGTSRVLPGYSFAATALSMLRHSGDLSFVDVDFESLSLDWEMYAKLHSDPSKLPVVVAPFGKKVDARAFSLASSGILDAAASLGQSILDPPKVPNGWVIVYSLHATKVLGVGEGGVAVFGSEDSAEEFRSYINFGYVGDTIGERFGTNGKMSEISAAFGLAALDDIEKEVDDWRLASVTANRLLQAFSTQFFHEESDFFHPYLIARFEDKARRDLAEKILRASGVGSRKWWPKSLAKLPAVQAARGHIRERLPNTERASDTLLGLPRFRGVGECCYFRIAEALETAQTS